MATIYSFIQTTLAILIFQYSLANAMNNQTYTQWITIQHPQDEHEASFSSYKKNIHNHIKQMLQEAQNEALCNKAKAPLNLHCLTKATTQSKQTIFVDQHGSLFYSNGKKCMNKTDIDKRLDDLLVSHDDAEQIIQNVSHIFSDDDDQQPISFDDFDIPIAPPQNIEPQQKIGSKISTWLYDHLFRTHDIWYISFILFCVLLAPASPLEYYNCP